MKECVILPADAGKRLDRWLSQAVPGLPASLAQKYLRTGRVKRDGKALRADARLAAGERLALYIEDKYFVPPLPRNPLLAAFRARLLIVHEDEHLLLADKRPGLLAHPDGREKLDTLIMHARAHLYQRGAWDGDERSPQAPALCNRLDRFTGGLVMIAKGAQAARAIDERMRAGQIEKRYLLLAKGRPSPPEGLLDDHLRKGAKRVEVVPGPAPGAQRALTRYWTLATHGPLSLVECLLITGRTHQIRAQFAAAGHPLLGDNQYGDQRFNARRGAAQQALYAYRLTFDFAPDGGPLAGVAGRSFAVARVPFAEAFCAAQVPPPRA